MRKKHAIEKKRYFEKMSPKAQRQSTQKEWSSKEWRNRVLVNVNNYCNLQCFSCAALCHTPMGSNTFRDIPRDTRPSHLALFLDRIRPRYKNAWIRFVGGEPMMSPYIEELARVARKLGWKTSILTNGYRLIEYNPFIFDHIHLDEHGINTETIEQCISYLESKRFRNYKVSIVTRHRDLSIRRSLPPQGRCRPMKLVTLWQDVVYPCCSMFYVEGWNNHTRGTDLLVEAGWCINNPDLADVLKNWEKTLPKEIFDVVCKPGCWKLRPKRVPGKNLVEWEKERRNHAC